MAGDRKWPISLKNSGDPHEDPFSGVTQPLRRSRSSILDRSEGSVFAALRRRVREPSFSTGRDFPVPPRR